MSRFVTPPFVVSGYQPEQRQEWPAGDPVAFRTYRVTGTWGSGDRHVKVGDQIQRSGGRKLTICVNDHPTDRSAITGTYFLEAIEA